MLTTSGDDAASWLRKWRPTQAMPTRPARVLSAEEPSSKALEINTAGMAAIRAVAAEQCYRTRIACRPLTSRSCTC